jgi:site-specific recombinase XerD
VKKLSTGIYRDRYGIRAIVHIAAGRKEKRFDPDTPLHDIKRWRNEMKVKLERLHPQKKAGAIGRGTFSAAVRKHLKTLTIASWKSRRSELKAWEKRFGKVKRTRISSDHVRAAVKAWTDDGVPPKTVLNRIRALTAMYHDLDGPDAWTPADGVPLPKVSRRLPAHVSVAIIRAVENKLREQADPKIHARYMVLTATGARPAHLKRAKPGDVDLKGRRWNVPAAKGGNPIELWLNDDMLAAWRAFVAANAWGDFDATEYAKAVRAAGWPADVPPYNAKHTLGRDLGEAGVDLETIADWYGHTDTKTTRIYTGVIASKLKAASEAINGRLGWGANSGPKRKKLAVSVGRLSTEARNTEIKRLLQRLSELSQVGS